MCSEDGVDGFTGYALNTCGGGGVGGVGDGGGCDVWSGLRWAQAPVTAGGRCVVVAPLTPVFVCQCVLKAIKFASTRRGSSAWCTESTAFVAARVESVVSLTWPRQVSDAELVRSKCKAAVFVAARRCLSRRCWAVILP
ncbi:hypothetical protein E2C01_027703 [Portunus trituberculatus]|uniref:Uncharacterized protein n=1 Tax=Portunus trituberculatus TaxID=210409 RepID=A0A5B7ELV9_PORTR|nr:hypothetical protein [Portunus trituberculatus]